MELGIVSKYLKASISAENGLPAYSELGGLPRPLAVRLIHKLKGPFGCHPPCQNGQ